jgi:type VI secretion system protein ImpH
VSLFYLAWKKNRFPANYLPGARDRLSGHLKSLIGIGLPSLCDRIGFADESLVFFAGLLSRQVSSAAALEGSIAYFAGTRVRVEQFAQRMLPLSPEDCTRIGDANSRLGLETVCGNCVWDCQTKFVIELGPMAFADFVRFLPSGDLLGPLFELVTYMAGLEFDFDIRVFLKRDEVPSCILGEAGPAAPQLGWTTWVKGQEGRMSDDPFVVFPSQDRS